MDDGVEAHAGPAPDDGGGDRAEPAGGGGLGWDPGVGTRRGRMVLASTGQWVEIEL